MELRNKTASVIVYKGRAYGPGQVIDYDDAHAEDKGVKGLIVSGGLEPTLGAKSPSDGLTVEQIKEALAAKGVEIPADATKKAQLAALLDAAG